MNINQFSPAKLNILHIITKLELGGAQKTTLELLARLDRSKYRLFLVTSPHGILTDEISKIPDIDTYLIPALKREISLFNDLKAFLKLSRYLKHKRIDIVHTHSSKAGILGRWVARFMRVPVVIHTIHGWSFHNSQNFLLRKLCIFLERLTARITDKLIAVAKSDIRKGEDSGIATDGKYNLIPYGLPLEKFTHHRVQFT